MMSRRTRSWGVGVAVTGGGFGPGGVGGGGSGPGRQGFVRPAGVVVAGERVELGLELGEGAGLGVLGGEPVLQGLLEPFGFTLGLGVVGLSVLLGDAQAAQLVLEGVAAAPAAGVPGGEHHPVVSERGGGCAVGGDGGAEGGQHDGAGDPVPGGD